MSNSYLNFEGLSHYDEKIKNYISTAVEPTNFDNEILSKIVEKVGEVPANEVNTDGSLKTVIDYLKKYAEDKDQELTGTITGTVAEIVANETQQRSDSDTALSNRITAIEDDYLTSSDKTDLTNKVDNLRVGNVSILNGINNDANETFVQYVNSLKTDLVDAQNKVTELIGTDANKSVRKIANEELAAQLISDNAQESLDTLTEIASWIQNHPDDASAMNAAILQIGLAVGLIPTANSTLPLTTPDRNGFTSVYEELDDIKQHLSSDFVAITNEQINNLFTA